MELLHEAACRTMQGKKADEFTNQLWAQAVKGDKRCLAMFLYLADFLLKRGGTGNPGVSLAINLAELEEWDESTPLAVVESLCAGRQARAGSM